MSAKPFMLSVATALVLSGGLALAARASGDALERGTEGVAVGLLGIAPPGRSTNTPRHADTQSGTEPLPPTPTPEPTRAGNRKKAEQGATAGGATPHRPRDGYSTARPAAPSASVGRHPAPPELTRTRRPPVLKLRADAPVCDDVFLYIASAFENPADSVATLSLHADRRGRQRKIGQHLGGYEVVGIGYNPRRVSSAVWLAKSSRICQALVQDANPVREKAQRLAERRERAARLKARKKRSALKKRRARRRGHARHRGGRR